MSNCYPTCFTCNIEETDLAYAIRAGGDFFGYLHFVDSNRQAVGRSHLDYEPIVAVLQDIQYAGYASAESLPIPDSDESARQTIESFQKYFRYIEERPENNEDVTQL